MTTADSADTRKRLADFVSENGEWTAFNIHLGSDIYTINPALTDERLRRIVQLLSDLAHKPLDQLRFADLACAEGHYAIEAAMHGCESVGIEGRERNTAKARFAQNILGLETLTFVTDDLRNFSKENYGVFDVVLAAGILYHLDHPDVFQFLERIGDACEDLLILDTYISLEREESFTYKDRTYHGRYYREHPKSATKEERELQLWSSLDNPRSFWLTRASLYNFLQEVGFTSVLEVHLPWVTDFRADRITLVAVKGKRAHALSSPVSDALPIKPYPEPTPTSVHPINDRRRRSIDLVRALLPGPLRRALKAILIKAGVVKPPSVGVKAPWTWKEPWKKRY